MADTFDQTPHPLWPAYVAYRNAFALVLMDCPSFPEWLRQREAREAEVRQMLEPARRDA